MRKRVRDIATMIVGATLVALAIPLLALRLLSPGVTTPFLAAQGNELLGSIAEIALVPLGGVQQFVLMRGRNASDPILLLLHGGPGDAQSAHFRHYNAALEDHFVVVNWDQRGAGRSYSPLIPSESMTVEQLIADAHELTEYLKMRFGKRKIVLAGHSWGSYLGIRTAARFPDDYFAWVGIGQVANQQESEAISYKTVLAEAQAIGSRRATEELKSVGPPRRGRYRGGIAGLGTQRKWVREFGGAAFCKNNFESLWLLIRPLLTFREYRLQDKLDYLKAETFSMDLLEEPMLDDNLTETLTEIHVPVFILQGRHDLQTVFETTRRYYDQLKAPYKQLVIFENSAHLVPFEEPEGFLRVMRDDVRPFAVSIDANEPK